MAARERSRLQRLDMTGTDERRSSRSRNGTPSRGDNFVPQPVFQLPHPLGNAPQMQGVEPPVIGDDPFRIFLPGDPGIINFNDDMPGMQIAPQWGPLSQEG